MNTTLQMQRSAAMADHLVATSEAWVASSRAAHYANECARLSQLAGIGEDDAAEASQAARRARFAEEQSRRTCDLESARMLARSAWAAAQSAQEAEERIRSAIVEAMMRPS